MAVTLSSWKQILEAKQGFDFPRHHVIVTPKGCVCFSMESAVLVRDEEEVPKLLDSDRVKINEECCCPPIEFNLVMGEEDVHRPGVSRPSYARFIWLTNVPTYGTIQWRVAGGTTWPYDVSGTIEERYHEYFDYGVVPGTDFEFRILAYRDFCGDAATSPIYSFRTCRGVLWLDTPNLANFTILTDLITATTTTLVYSPFITSTSTGAPSGYGTFVLSVLSTQLFSISAVSEQLTNSYFYMTAPTWTTVVV